MWSRKGEAAPLASLAQAPPEETIRMERPLWDRVQEIYYSILPMEQSERSAFVASACDHDPILSREVNSLIEADESSGGFLEAPVFGLGLRVLANKNRKDAQETTLSTLDNLVGSTIDGHYLVESELGHGGMGKVYLARDLSLHNRRVVIKVLLQASLGNAYVVRKFRQEVEALARIDHPGVVSVLGAGKLTDGKLYLVMQYVSGRTLRSEISNEGMDLERAALILQQIGAALEDVHEKRIFHRDLKPENIMLQVLRSAELVKVVDFGIAKVKDSVVAPSTANDMAVGTVLYMSPEQLRGGEQITAASDIYSMAVIAYEMLTGRRPFNPASAPQLLEMHRAGVRVRPIDLRTNLSSEAQAIILRALSFAPEARYQSATEFGDSLARALVNDGEMPPRSRSTDPSLRSTGKSIPTGTWSIRNRVAAAVLLVLLSAGVLYGVYKYSQRNETPGVVSGPSHAFTYFLTVQKMRDGKPYQEPFLSTGDVVFETGYQFRLNLQSPDGGHLYLFNEGPSAPDGTSFTIIYPTPATNDGSAAIKTNQLVSTNWNTFTEPAGTENFWIVWSANPISELEAARTEAFKHPKGALTGPMLTTVKEFLSTKQSEVKTRSTRDKDKQMVTVRGTGDLLIKKVEFEHR